MIGQWSLKQLLSSTWKRHRKHVNKGARPPSTKFHSPEQVVNGAPSADLWWDYISRRPCQVGPCWMWLQDWFRAMAWGAVTCEHPFRVLKGKADALLFPIPVLTGGMHMWWWEVEQPLWAISGSRALRKGAVQRSPRSCDSEPRTCAAPLPRCKAKLLLYLRHSVSRSLW